MQKVSRPKDPARKHTRKAPVKKRPAPVGTLPAGLTGEVARSKWREKEPQLRDRLNLLDIDDDILILYCNCWQSLVDCQTVLAKKGRYNTMDTGYETRRPAAIDEQKWIAQIRQLADALGMTPKSGRRVTVRSGSGDGLKEFLEAGPPK